MFADTFADPQVIRALGSANAAHAADLSDIAAVLSSLPVTPAMLGPVGARFLAALADAAAEGARAVAELGGRLAESNTVAYAAAAAYEDTDRRAADHVAGV
jgi:hypothetical protein